MSHGERIAVNEQGGIAGKARPALYAVLSLAVTAAALLPTLGNGFTTWDDPLYILENPLVRSLSPAGIAKIFTTGQYAGNYHPFTLLFTAVEYALFGTAPFGYHLVSLLLHLGVVLLVFRFVAGLTGSTLTAFGVALLFGVHPLHLEPVAWLADQKDLLYSFFYLGALVGYLRVRERGTARDVLVWTVPLFLISLLSKGLAVTLPVVLLLVEVHLGGTLRGAAARRVLPLFALSVAFGVVAIVAQKSAGAVSNLPSETALDIVVYASTGFVTYIAKLLVPFGISPYHPYPAKMPAWTLAAPFITAGIAAAAVLWRRKSPTLFFGVAFFTVTILPVLQIVQVGNALMADRYAYLPSIGILLILVDRMVKAGERLRGKVAAGRTIAGVTGGVYALTLAAMTFSLGGIWRDGFTVWDRVVKEYPGEAKAYFNRGYAAHTLGDYAGAIADYNMTLSLNPAYPYAHFNRGTSEVLNGNRGNLRDALADFNSELAVHPDDPTILLWRGTLYSNISEFDLAIADFTKVLAADSGNFNALTRRASALTSAGRLPEALRDYTAAIALRPSELYLTFNRANILAAMGRYGEAVEDYSAVLRESGNDRDVLYGRALALHLMGNDVDACPDFRRAADLGLAPARTAFVEICGK